MTAGSFECCRGEEGASEDAEDCRTEGAGKGVSDRLLKPVVAALEAVAELPGELDLEAEFCDEPVGVNEVVLLSSVGKEIGKAELELGAA